MKQIKAIKLLREGKIQIENDFLPSTKEIKKLLKKAFPDMLIENRITENESNSDEVHYCSSNIKNGFKRIKLSSISKGKNKLKQKVSELVKDVAEVKEYIIKQEISIAESKTEETPIKDEEMIYWGKPQFLELIEHKGTLVFYDGFSGICVKSTTPLWYVGEKWAGMDKRGFKPFKGTLTINQE